MRPPGFFLPIIMVEGERIDLEQFYIVAELSIGCTIFGNKHLLPGHSAVRIINAGSSLGYGGFCNGAWRKLIATDHAEAVAFIHTTWYLSVRKNMK